MSRHDPLVSMRQMPDHGREAVRMAEGRNRADLDQSRMLQLALVRLVEIIGEAARRVAPGVRAEHPQIPWAVVAGMRDRLASATIASTRTCCGTRSLRTCGR